VRTLALALLVVSSVASAQPSRMEPSELPSTAEPPEIVLLTFGVGPRIFEKFGHAALCLHYPREQPVCFNYGVTNFDAGAPLVWGFLRGEQKFWVDPEAWSTIVEFYELDAAAYTLTATARAGTAVQIEQPFPLEIDAGQLVR